MSDSTNATASSVRAIVQEELARGTRFTNFHGITAENLSSLLAEPYPIRVDPDEGPGNEAAPTRELWVVLQQSAQEGLIIAYDPHDRSWAVVEHGSLSGKADYTLVVAANSLAQALDGM